MVKTHHEADHPPVAEVAKKHGLSEQAIDVWRRRLGFMGADEIKQLKTLARRTHRSRSSSPSAISSAR